MYPTISIDIFRIRQHSSNALQSTAAIADDDDDVTDNYAVEMIIALMIMVMMIRTMMI